MNLQNGLISYQIFLGVWFSNEQVWVGWYGFFFDLYGFFCIWIKRKREKKLVYEVIDEDYYLLYGESIQFIEECYGYIMFSVMIF